MKCLDREVLLMAVGDIYINREEPKTAFRDILPLFKDKDILFGNLETTLIDKQLPAMEGRVSPMMANQKMIEGIVEANFDLVSLANNHTTDYGPSGLLKTIKLLDRNKILYVGAGKNIKEAKEPVIITKNNFRIGFLAYEATVWSFGGDAKKERPGVAKINVNPLLPYPHVAKEDLTGMAQHIKNVKTTVDILIVSLHCGAELTTTLSPHQKSIAHAAVDSGADIVVGHHPHVLQGVETYKGKVICYSLGNFIFDEEFFYSGETIIIRAKILSTGMKISLVPVFLNDKGKLELLEESESKYKGILRKMVELSQGLGTKINGTTGELVI